jgi:ATP-dependent Clp protease, protease subunit
MARNKCRMAGNKCRIGGRGALWANSGCLHVGRSVPAANVGLVNPVDTNVSPLEMNGDNQPSLDDHIYQRLLKERIVFLGSEVRDSNANAICAQMLLLNAEDPVRDIFLYINSPGGSVDSGMAIYDTMQYISNDVATVAMGLAASMGQFLVCAGAPGKRYALPHARIMMHQPTGGMGGSASDIKIQAQQSLHIKKQLFELIGIHTGQSVEQVEQDADRDRWFTAEQAMEYGFIDHVVASAGQVADQGRPAK